jgi:deazaflavin-dependent oxidoreductase (nitroreductase family)
MIVAALDMARQPMSKHRTRPGAANLATTGRRGDREASRVDKYRLVNLVQKHVANPVVRTALNSGWPVPGYALLETTGRKSGEPRRVPVGDGLDGDTFWVVSEHGRRSAYVRNIEAHPRVRVRVRGRWRAGTAHLVHDDDPRRRQRLLARRFSTRLNAAAVRVFGTDLLTVRIDLDPRS